MLEFVEADLFVIPVKECAMSSSTGEAAYRGIEVCRHVPPVLPRRQARTSSPDSIKHAPAYASPAVWWRKPPWDSFAARLAREKHCGPGGACV